MTIDIDGWEGPLDLLLALARHQKVDLRQISILDLVAQYLDFVERARHLKLELAADYLVMAAWLTYLKSGLLLPKDPAIDPSPEELALRLQLRLERLNAMREAGGRLLARNRIGRDVFFRGTPEGLKIVKQRKWTCNLFDLMTAYGQVQSRNKPAIHMVKRRRVMTLEDALSRISKMIGHAIQWTEISAFLPLNLAGEGAGEGADAGYRKSALASTFLASLELARHGRVEIRQDAPFAPLMLRQMAGMPKDGAH
ncbi:segregation/condensation protein A [Sphingorhabdus lutea]|uniref:Segregation and condensation protein A n=1 Tax=Sphingorhabdus lutea TaxID=1913578 RepID=A0A1L3JF45_9SPHN|nr:segregation/condensation protein A [Sphingorhabdus lutea]